MSKIFFSGGMSLDGFIAVLNGGPENPLEDNGTKIHEWIYKQKASAKPREWAKEGKQVRIMIFVNEITNRIGENIIGKRMFKESGAAWPDPW